MSTAQSKLPSFEGENREKYDGPDTSKYVVYKMTDLDGGDLYHADDIYLTDIYENEWDKLDDEGLPTGETTKKYSAGLHVINHKAEWKIKARINLKKKDDSFEASQKSGLYDLIGSLIEYNQPGSAWKFDIIKGSFKQWQEHINELKDINVEIIEHEGFNGGNPYSTIQFTKKEVPEVEE